LGKASASASVSVGSFILDGTPPLGLRWKNDVRLRASASCSVQHDDDEDEGAIAGASCVAPLRGRRILAKASGDVFPIVGFAEIVLNLEGVLLASGPAASAGVVVEMKVVVWPTGDISTTDFGRKATEGKNVGRFETKLRHVINTPHLQALWDGRGLSITNFRLGAGANTPSSIENASASAEFSNTLTLASFNFYDRHGRFVDGIEIVDEQGNAFPVNVPETSRTPYLSIQQASPTEVLISWPTTSETYQLEEASELKSPTWSKWRSLHKLSILNSALFCLCWTIGFTAYGSSKEYFGYLLNRQD